MPTADVPLTAKFIFCIGTGPMRSTVVLYRRWHTPSTDSCNYKFLLHLSSGAEYCDYHVSKSLCLGNHMSKYSVLVACGHESVLLWQCYHMLNISGFADDVTFSYSGPYGRIMLSQQHCCNVVNGITWLVYLLDKAGARNRQVLHSRGGGICITTLPCF